MVTAAPGSTHVRRSTSQRTDDEIHHATQQVLYKLRLLQAYDIAEIGKERQYSGMEHLSFEAAIGYGQLVRANIRRYLTFLVETWTAYITGISIFYLGADISGLFFSVLASAALLLVLLFTSIANYPPARYCWELVFGSQSARLSLSNFSNPNLFKCLNQAQSDAAKAKMAAVINPNAQNPRAFDLDIAKFLLQVSSLMYERHEREAVRNAVDEAHTRCDPHREEKGKRSANDKSFTPTSFNQEDIQRLYDILAHSHEVSEQSPGPIEDFAMEHGICFATASELLTTSQAYCSLFWDPRSTWVVVAFKGTDPISFDEWTTNLTVRFQECGEDIPGFNRVHRGFKDRILPATGSQPYHKIIAAIKIVCEDLVEGQDPDTKINVWFTGHSLGTAIGSLAYAKALLCHDLGPHALLRDAYMFASPVVCDVDSRQAFNRGMEADAKVPRTLWRITNRDDIVATGLPEYGNTLNTGLPGENIFNFSHLGVEIFLKHGTKKIKMRGDPVKAPSGFKVQIASTFDKQVLAKMRKEVVRRKWNQPVYLTLLQAIPLLGRVFAHFTTNYWESLDRLTLLPVVEKRSKYMFMMGG